MSVAGLATNPDDPMTTTPAAATRFVTPARVGSPGMTLKINRQYAAGSSLPIDHVIPVTLRTGLFENGKWVRRERTSEVHLIHKGTWSSGVPKIYEMGIPVQEIEWNQPYRTVFKGLPREAGGACRRAATARSASPPSAACTYEGSAARPLRGRPRRHAPSISVQVSRLGRRGSCLGELGDDPPRAVADGDALDVVEAVAEARGPVLPGRAGRVR